MNEINVLCFCYHCTVGIRIYLNNVILVAGNRVYGAFLEFSSSEIKLQVARLEM